MNTAIQMNRKNFLMLILAWLFILAGVIYFWKDSYLKEGFTLIHFSTFLFSILYLSYVIKDRFSYIGLSWKHLTCKFILISTIILTPLAFLFSSNLMDSFIGSFLGLGLVALYSLGFIGLPIFLLNIVVFSFCVSLVIFIPYSFYVASKDISALDFWSA